MEVNKKRILFIAPLPPPIHGSGVVSQQIKDSVRINDAFTCDWVNMSTSRRMDEIGNKNPIKLIRVISSLFRTLCFLVTNNYVLCYLAITCHGVGFLKDAPFVLLCKLFGRKIVIHQHNKGMSKDIDKWPYRWLMPLCYNNVKVILLSWNLYPDIEKVVSRDNVMICPNGIHVNHNVINNKNRGFRNVPNLLFLSNLIESKGVLVLLDSLKILKDHGYSFICNFVGGESKELDKVRFIKEVNLRGLDNYVFYLGKKYGEEKEEVYKQSDIFVFPTFYSNECFPLVLLEAMMHKLPCVTTSEGGIPDIVEDGINGRICERNNSHSLAVCISSLLNDSDLCYKMGVAGYNHLLNNYTDELFEINLLNCLKRTQSLN